MSESPQPPEPDSPVDVAIVGGGVIGVACALELARRGASVVVLERDRIGHACSFGNAGWLTPSLALPLPAPGMLWKAAKWMLDPESPFYVPLRPDPKLAAWLFRFLLATRRDRFERGTEALVELCRWSVDRWEALSEESTHLFGFARTGLVAVYESAEGLAAGQRAAALVERFGVEHERWSAEEVREREPAVRGPQVGALFFPRDAHCEPFPAVAALAAEAERAGARLIEGAEVYGSEGPSRGVRTLLTTRGRFRTHRMVLTAGAWSGSLGKRLGLRLPVLGAKGYSIVVPPLAPHPNRSIMLAERKIAINPHASALRISGTLELVGEDLSINARRVDAIVKAARGLLDLPDPLPIRELWRGLRPCTPDGMPVIGQVPGDESLWLATGHQMTGLKTAPGTGRLLAELICGEPPTFDPTPFRTDRF